MRIGLGIAVILAACYPATAKVRPFLLSGQSNMEGYARVVEDAVPSDIPPVPIWNAFGWKAKEWGSLRTGLGRDSVSMGPEIGIGIRLAAAFPEDTVVLVKVAIGGTSLALDWLPPSAGGPGSFYTGLGLWILEGSSLWKGDFLPPFEGVFWMQGESDAEDSAAARAYGFRLASLITDFRKDRADSALPWVIGLVDSVEHWAHVGLVRAAQRDVADSLEHVGWVETEGLETDGAHFTARGQMGLGTRMARRWLALQGFLPDSDLAPSSDGVARRSGPGTYPPGTRMRCLGVDGRIRAVWVVGAGGPVPPMEIGQVAIVEARWPDGRVEVRRRPPSWRR